MDYHKELCKKFHPDCKTEILDKKVATSIMKVINSIRHSNHSESVKQEKFKNLYNRLLNKSI